jgi:hypothetical protein
MEKEQEMDSLSGCFVRLAWFIIGPIFLILGAIIIATNRLAFPGIADLVYAIIAVAAIAARLIDIPGKTKVSEEQHKTANSSALKYIVIFGIVSVILLAIAHLIKI